MTGLFWHVARSAAEPLPALRAAVARSVSFDRAFGFSRDASKSAVVGGAHLQPLASELGYERKEELEALGLVHPLDLQQPKRLLRFVVDKFHLRLRFIAGASRNPGEILRHVRSLGNSLFQWAGGFAQPSPEQLQFISGDIRASFRRCLLHDAATPLFHELMDWWTEPTFVAEWGTLCAAIRLQTCPPRWTHQVPLDQAFDRWPTLLPEAPALLAKHNWTADRRGDTITRCDEYGVLRTFRLGWDSPKILRDWLLLAYRRYALNKCGRVRRSFHRDDVRLARGLDLAAPALNQFVLAAGHKRVWRHAEAGPERQAAPASGCSYWHYNAKWFEAQTAKAECLCGLLQPSRPHLTWNCERTASTRPNLALPVDRCEERLFARPRREIPKPPHSP